MKAQYEKIIEYTEAKKPLDPIGALTAIESENLTRRKDPGERSDGPQIRAKRFILHRFASQARNCSEETASEAHALLLKLGGFASKRDANRYFFNRQGALYRSLFSTSKHQPYAIDEDAIERHDLLAQISDFVEACERRAFSNIRPEWSEVRDWLVLERAYYTLMLSGLTIPLPTELAKPDLAPEAAKIPPVLRALLEEQWIDPDVVKRIFNLYISALSGLSVRLGRNEFFVRVRFQQVGDAGLQYLPKPVTWSAPARLWQTDKPIRAILDDAWIIYEGDRSDRKIRVLETAEKIFSDPGKKDKSRSPEPLGAYLMQAPHDWGYKLNTKTPADGAFGIKIKKGTIRAEERTIAARLVGASSFKNVLDRLLTERSDHEVGDVTTIIDNRFSQSLVTRADGTLGVELVDEGYTISIAVPITEKKTYETEEFPIADRYVAIDQGEIGLGYAVFDAASRNKLLSGTVKIPSIRNLIKAASKFRKREQPNQKFQQRFDSTMFTMRENVAGDVCHEIINLMRKYKAFPILESNLMNLESGSKQLELVYKAVSQYFIYSDIDAHKKARQSYWMGGSVWPHPELLRWEIIKGEKTTKKKPLNLFPGASVHPAGTSQTCSRCERNPIRTVRALAEEGQKQFEVNVKGEVTLNGEVIVLRTGPRSEKEYKKYRRKNERAQLTEPFKAGTYDLKNLITAIKRNIRRPPQSVMTKDTTQSRYFCVYKDCRYEIHADENAAINIGVKFATNILCD